ncbi:receptor-type tyrosine-protein phosphatase epsilon-like [Mya arenaria]|uniref:receptor-type tyrosine-protein phosphatase epsilon-like n=1 Tax=Mya arenaria TaxID=6604 RepID=UPI0022E0CAE5|nr:receptor-type tyrosine-protein phosphatase epsilon-like [Mya arenaria]
MGKAANAIVTVQMDKCVTVLQVNVPHKRVSRDGQDPHVTPMQRRSGSLPPPRLPGRLEATGYKVNGTAQQSSTYKSCSAEKAFDGEKIFQEPESSCTCSVTGVDEIPRWWEMNFGSKHLIGSIKVSGRDTCSLGYFGQNCSKKCSQHCKNDDCNPQNGSCIKGCKPGYDYTMSTNCSVAERTKDTDVNYYVFENNIPGIQIHNLWDYIRENKKKRGQHFNDEFIKLPTGLVHKHEVAGREEYKGKNRYREMYAYDHSRVPLQKERDGDCDYINASYIDGYCKARKFIASQGPTNNMIDDFWRMVWQENVEKIVMLTNLIEMATVKCLQYWPEMDQTCSFGGIDISITVVKKFRDYEIRTLIAKKAKCKPREIQQYHFKAWPDKDVPDNGWCLVEFLNVVETQSTNSPIIVHCSAGVGRTGTFVALDNLVEQAKTEKCVKPLEMVKALRRQRVNMVQTKDQYIYLHEALAEALLMGTDHIWHRQFENVHPFMIARETGEEQSRLVKQFQSFSGNNTFLICKSPCEEQLEEFWSLVEEQHVITIIMLTSTSSPAYQV